MCGIFGFFGDPDSELLAAMAERLQHRGPDDRGELATAEVSLGADRLAIVGAANGHQPVCSEDESVVAVCNGEIYNFRELRIELERRGHRFATATDSEVIVHLYEDEGEAAFGQLEGMFAIALWDARKRRLLLARDPVGMKPLFYVTHGGRFVFASEVKALLTLPGFARRLDLTALDSLLALTVLPGERTLFEGIRRLPPGHQIRVAAGVAPVLERYFVAVADSRDHFADDDAAPEFLRRFFAAVERHLVSDMPLGAALSGGLDSSLVVAAMSRILDRPVRTYAVGFAGERDERPFARRVAEHCRTDHSEVTWSGDDLLSVLPRLVWQLEEPRNGPLLPNDLLFRQAAADGVRVVLVGEGADELFGGYQRLKTALGPLAYLPRGLGRAAYLTPQSFGRRGRSLLTAAACARLDGEPTPVDAALSAVFALRGEARGQALLQFEQRDRMPNGHLMRVDLLSMAHSVEARLPFLDRRLIALANRLPLAWKTRFHGEKRVLRHAARQLLPPEIANRPKLGQPNPLAFWRHHGLLDLAAELLDPRQVAHRDLLRPRSVDRLLSRVARRRALPFDLARLNLFVLLEIWHRLFLDPTVVVPPALPSPPRPVAPEVPAPSLR